MANIFDFGDKVFEDSDKKKEYTAKENDKQTTEQDAKQLYDKYKNYSQSELLEEFLTTSKEKLQNGSLTYEKLQKTSNMLSPYLNKEQKELLKGLIDKLND